MTRRIELSRRLVLEAVRRLPDGLGGFDAVWEAQGMLWADVRAKSGREDVVGGQVRSRVIHRILVRAAPLGSASRPRPDQRLRDGARVYDIRAVTEHGTDGRFLEILAEEGANP